jgi:microcystin-dependent protein
MAGVETVTLTAAEMPSHSHSFSATVADANTSDISSSVLTGKPTVGAARLYAINQGTANPQVNLDPGAVGFAGNSAAHSNLMPSLCVSFLIALQGIFPSRN